MLFWYNTYNECYTQNNENKNKRHLKDRRRRKLFTQYPWLLHQITGGGKWGWKDSHNLPIYPNKRTKLDSYLNKSGQNKSNGTKSKRLSKGMCHTHFECYTFIKSFICFAEVHWRNQGQQHHRIQPNWNQRGATEQKADKLDICHPTRNSMFQFYYAPYNTHLRNADMALTITSWNVKGLGSPIKRTKILGHLKKLKTNIALLQETHMSAQDYFRLRK